MAEMFGVDIAGRVRNLKLSKNESLFPLFEAVVNSIQAIEDRKQEDAEAPDGEIMIEVFRDLTLPVEDMQDAAISSFVIHDNGIGFTGDNFKSFLQSDSTYKEARGGKGVGRFCWLKVFTNASIISNYMEGDEGYCRSFDFNLTTTSLADDVSDLEGNVGTVVKLSDVRQEFKGAIPCNTNEIAAAIMHHCAVYLLLDECPIILLKDDGLIINLNDEFSKAFKNAGECQEFLIKGHSFTLTNMRMSIDDVGTIKLDKKNRVMLCADKRCVEEFDLDNHLKGLGAILKTKYDFYYLGILTGEYLDETVDAERQSFSFENEGSLFEDDGITKKEIIDVLEDYVDDYLREYIDAANEERAKSVDDYVANEAPQYKPLLEHIPQLYEKVKYGADSESVEDVLHDAKRNLEKEMKKKTDELLSMTDNEVLSSDEYVQEFKDQIKLVNDINKSTLAEYVARRKAVLNIFEKSLQYLRTGKYENESYLHELIFPMQATDRDVTYETHNLWLIDERLTYSTYLASDLSLGKAAGKKRPDILSLQDPQDPVLIADEENSGREFNAVSIFELKKPMRDDYTDEKNPINQLLTYVEKLQEGNAIDSKGRPINIGDHTRIYLYAVCDITKSLEKFLKKYDFTKMPDGLGWYRHYNNYNAYIEILPFDKVLNDAKARNRVFFEKLGIL